MNDNTPGRRMRVNRPGGVAAGAGLGLVFGAAFGNPGAGLVLGAACGVVLPALVERLWRS